MGHKSGERLILELKDKAAAVSRAVPAALGDKPREDALSALLNLGYPKNLAEKALDAPHKQCANTLEDLLRQSLKWLAK